MTSRRALAACLALVLAFGATAPLAQASAVFAGAVIDPSGAPAPGFQVVFKDVLQGTTFLSSKTDAQGQYQVTVPVGGRYKLDTVLAPDGTRLPVQDVPPINVRVPGRTRLDVTFQKGVQAPPRAAEPPAVASAKKPEAVKPKGSVEPPKKKLVVDAKRPWWKSPLGVTGIVVGAAAAAALLLGGGGGGGNASPSNP